MALFAGLGPGFAVEVFAVFAGACPIVSGERPSSSGLLSELDEEESCEGFPGVFRLREAFGGFLLMFKGWGKERVS